ncbi:MAG: GntR family transcriptional regulator [Anaerolineae bacterium]|nr:GntR family transcriptional regulator [Anaerolineae bacterium]
MPIANQRSIYKIIRERITLLEYEPGETISENALATEFGVSRTPVRRVLQRLESEGLVISRQGVGTLVTMVDIKLLKEVYALRLKLAELIGELSATPASDGDLNILDSLLQQCEAMREKRDYRALARLNMEFNDALVCFISNKPFQEITDRLYYQTARVWPRILPDMNWAEEVDFMYTEIKEITAALRAGDMQRVGQVRRDHISNSLSRIQRYLGEGNVR